MTTFLLALVVVVGVPALAGFLVVNLLWQPPVALSGARLAHLGLKIALGLGVGIGLGSYVAFGARMAEVGLWGFAAVEILALTVLLLIYRRSSQHGPTRVRAAAGPLERVAYGGLAVAVAGTAVIISTLALRKPFGGWDATAIWNLRARFIYRAATDWIELTLAPQLWWSHTDYPLLLPMSIVRGWSYLGHETSLVPVLTAVAFALATLLLLVCAATILSGATNGAVAGLLLVGTPAFGLQAMAQYADVVLTFYLLATIVLICLALRWPDERSGGLWILVGVCGSLAAWTKNEGIAVLLFTALAAAVLAILRVRGCGWRSAAAMALGSLGGLAVLAYFKMALAGPNDLVAAVSNGNLERIITWERHWTILRAFRTETLEFGAWTIHPAWLIGLVWLGFGWAARERLLEIAVVASVLGGVAATYFLAYVVSPYDLAWHLSSSLDRLFLHLWPAAILLVCVVTKSPDIPTTQ